MAWGGARRSIERRAGCAAVLLALCCGGSGRDGRRDAPASSQDASAEDVCGMPEQACCAAPRFACALGLACDDAGICRAGDSDRPDASRLCQTDVDCDPARRCCSAGRYGTCQPIESGACASPDLAVLASGAGVTPLFDTFDGVARSEGGCVRERGVRRRLRISAAIANFGAADFILGPPDAARVSGAGSRDDFVHYSLIDAAGEPVASSRGPLPCSDDPAEPFSCAFAGLPAGALVPTLGLECEALDVTGVPAGDYRLRIELAPAWRDADAENDRVEMPLDLPSFNPLDPCPAGENPLLGVGSYRECGWSPLPAPRAGRCDPGRAVVLDCGSCENQPMLRMCAGDAACSASSMLAQASGSWLTKSGQIAELCSSILGMCPPIGRYNVLVAAEDPALPASCTLIESSFY